MKRPEAFWKMKSEKENGTLTQLPRLHPSSKHDPDPDCDQCKGTGWILYPPNHFSVLESKFKYDGHDTTFCACTFFSKEDAQEVSAMLSHTVNKLSGPTIPVSEKPLSEGA